MTPAPRLSIGQVFSSMRRAFDDHRELLVRVTLLFAALSALTSTIEIAGTAGAAISIGIQLFLSVSYSGAVAVLICSSGPIESVGDLWGRTGPVLARLIWVRLLTAIAILGGLVLLIIPGLILMTIWAVAFQVVAVEKVGVIAALARSRELVRGNGWPVFAFILALGALAALLALLAMVVALPLGTGVVGGAVSVFLIGLTAAPLAAAGPAALYGELTGESPEPALPEFDA